MGQIALRTNRIGGSSGVTSSRMPAPKQSQRTSDSSVPAADDFANLYYKDRNMNVGFHFDLRLAYKALRSPVPGWGIARKVIEALRSQQQWLGPVDLYMEALLFDFRDSAHFEKSKNAWLASLKSHWCHFGSRASLDSTDLSYLFAVLLTNVEQEAVEKMLLSLRKLAYYHSSLEIDISSGLHQVLYFESLLPRVSLINAYEAAVLVEAGGSNECDVEAERTLRKCGFHSIYYDGYLPWNYLIRERLSTS